MPTAEVIDIVEAFADAKRRNPFRPVSPFGDEPDRFEALLDAMPDCDEAILELCRDVIFPRLRTIFAERGRKLVIRSASIDPPRSRPAVR